MNKLLTKGQLSVLIVFGVLIIDQIIKILVKTNMFWHESIRITDWFYIYFTENNGMAFGMELFGKLFLTTFRIVAVGLIIWYLAKIIKENYKTGYIVCVRDACQHQQMHRVEPVKGLFLQWTARTALPVIEPDQHKGHTACFPILPPLVRQ